MVAVLARRHTHRNGDYQIFGGLLKYHIGWALGGICRMRMKLVASVPVVVAAAAEVLVAVISRLVAVAALLLPSNFQQEKNNL